MLCRRQVCLNYIKNDQASRHGMQVMRQGRVSGSCRRRSTDTRMRCSPHLMDLTNFLEDRMAESARTKSGHRRLSNSTLQATVSSSPLDSIWGRDKEGKTFRPEVRERRGGSGNTTHFFLLYQVVSTRGVAVMRKIAEEVQRFEHYNPLKRVYLRPSVWP